MSITALDYPRGVREYGGEADMIAAAKERRAKFFPKPGPVSTLAPVPPMPAPKPLVIYKDAPLQIFTVPLEAYDQISEHVRQHLPEAGAAALLAHLSVRQELAAPVRPTIRDIQIAAAQHFGVSRDDLLSSRRTSVVVRPRQIAMYLAKTMTLNTLPEIGRRFGGRDHTTVLHAVSKMERLIAGNPQVRGDMAAIRVRIEA